MVKYHLIFFMFIFIIFIGCSTQNNETDNSLDENLVEENNIVIAAVGDSLTEGYGLDRDDAYPAILEEKLISLGYDVEVYNSGYSGETSTAALNRMDWVLQLEPDIVILTTGANDAMRGINLSITRDNIESMIDLLQENKIEVILSGMEIYENLGDNYVNEFKDMYPEIASEKDVFFIEFFLEGVAGNISLNQDDRIHPTREGYEIIVENNILPVLLPVIDNLGD